MTLDATLDKWGFVTLDTRHDIEARLLGSARLQGGSVCGEQSKGGETKMRICSCEGCGRPDANGKPVLCEGEVVGKR